MLCRVLTQCQSSTKWVCCLELWFLQTARTGGPDLLGHLHEGPEQTLHSKLFVLYHLFKFCCVMSLLAVDQPCLGLLCIVSFCLVLFTIQSIYSNEGCWRQKTFKNSVQSRSAPSRKILRLLMARAEIARTCLMLLLSAPELHQHLVLPKIPQKVKGHKMSCAQPKLPTAITSLYVGVFSYHDNYSFILLISWMGPRKSSAAFIFLLIVYERNFYCLVRTILVRTKDERVHEKGIRLLRLSYWIFYVTSAWEY